MNENFEELKKLLDENELIQANDLLNLTSQIELNETSQLEGLLYFCYIKEKITLDEIQANYSEEVFKTVSILDKLDHINYDEQVNEAENLRKMFFAITKDVRTIMLKIAYVLSEVHKIDGKSEKEKEAIANSIFCLYAPLSARLGLSAFKSELENTAFKMIHPDIFNKIQLDVDNRFHKRQPIVERLTKLVENCLNELHISGKVYGRKKHIYSIYKKLENHTIDEIYDLIAVRAIVKTIPACYALLGKLNSVLEPMKNRFKDYISNPKSNGYQSLHTTVIFENFPVEIQIRTEEMHQYAEYGIAAHWLYKEHQTQDSLDIKLAWIRQMMENEEVSIDELAKSLNEDAYGSNIYVQTPKGKVIYLPADATPIDFAYIIHTEVGNKCVGAKVNGKMVPVNSQLHNADVVEIITNPNSKGPSRDWLKICKTSEAKSKIRDFFKKNMRDETIKLGKSMIENILKEKGYSVSKLMSSENIKSVLEHFNLPEEELYLNVGTNAISSLGIANRLTQNYKSTIQKEEESTPDQPNVIISTPSDKLVELKDLNNVLISFANCCHPMYGDDIIGFISTGRGVIVHRKICPNVSYFSKSRLIETTWKSKEKIKKKH